MKNKIAGTVAAGIAALLIPAVSVQAVTVNFGTAATVSSDSIQGWPKGPDTVSETVLIDADTQERFFMIKEKTNTVILQVPQRS